MNNFVPSKPSQTLTGPALVALSAAMATSPMATSPIMWRPNEEPSFVITQTQSSYSEISSRAIFEARQVSRNAFVQDVAALYTSFSERQQRLGAEFEAALFDDLESLYEA